MAEAIGSVIQGLSCAMTQVWDNGEGMTAEGLRQWAVMNLSMEDRGMQPSQPPDAAGSGAGSGAGSFLDAQLSFFGVRSSQIARG